MKRGENQASHQHALGAEIEEVQFHRAHGEMTRGFSRGGGECVIVTQQASPARSASSSASSWSRGWSCATKCLPQASFVKVFQDVKYVFWLL